MPRRCHALCVPLVIATLIAGCNSSKSTTPTAPTAAVPDVAVGIDLNVVTPPGTQGAGIDKPLVGTVGQLTGTCPNIAFVLSGVKVRVTSRTMFESGTCGDVKEGIRAGVMGTKSADGSIEARRVKIAPLPPPPPPPPPHVEGPVAGLTGTCPALTFTLAGTTVHTTDKTVFEGGSCADVKEGRHAVAAGPKDATAAINAERVRLAPPLPHVGGSVSSISGTCPAVSFVVAPPPNAAAPSRVTVRVNDKTRYEGGACADLKVDVRVGAMGPKAADGTIEARVVKIGPPR